MSAQLSYAQATPKWADKAKKAVFSIVTYDKENKIKNTGNGFYINENGTALSDYTLFEGAERAVIINADSKELPVLRIWGASSIYDLVKFNTEADKKTVALKPATQPATVGETVYLLPYSTQKSATCQTGTVTKVDTIGDKAYYYTLAMTTNEKTVSCPIMNANGEVLGLIQKNASDETKESYAIGATYGALLNITALSLNDMSLSKIGIRKGLPDTEDQALVYLFMAASQQTREDHLATLNDFLEQYPNSAEGYVRRANAYIETDDNEQNAMADKDLKKALEVTANKGETQYNIAKLMYSYALSLGDKAPYGDWGYDKALSSIEDAIQTDNQPIYIQLKGDILFAMEKYSEAYTAYEKVN
ncbi:MAG: serine protease, partial [Phocaeicola sp.]|nr:serine protease [Phocaeicola sp.]